MKTAKEILEKCIEKKKGELKSLTNRQLAIIDDLTEKMFSEGLTEIDLPEDFGKPTDKTQTYINKDLNLALYLSGNPPVISLTFTDIDKIDKLN